jgi:hypothetical protein
MSKRPVDHVRESDERLAQVGVAASASPAELAAAFGRDPDVDLAIIGRLSTMATTESAETLRHLEREASKSVRREIKRALYRLQQRGIDPPRLPTTPRAVQVSAEIEAYVSAFDGHGDRLVWLIKPRPGSVSHLFAVLNDPAGLREVALNRLTRRAVRDVQEELQHKHDIRMVPVDWRHADLALYRGLEWARQRGRSVDGDYLALRAQLTSEPVPDATATPIDALADTVATDSLDRDASADLLLEPELRTWLLDEELARDALQQLAEIRDSPLVLSDAQLRERFDSLSKRLVDQAFGGDLRPSWERRMAEMAHYFAATSRPVRARQAAAVALAMRGEDAPSQIAFCAAYVQRTLGLHFAAAEQQEEEARKSSLVLTPGQLRRPTGGA